MYTWRCRLPVQRGSVQLHLSRKGIGVDTVALMWISTVAYLAFIGILLKLKLKDNNGNFIVKIVGRIKPLPINTRTGKPIQLIEIFIKVER